MTDELVKRLRAYNDESFVETLCGEAADRIEALTAERDVAIKWWGESTELVRQARLQYSEEKARAEAATAERDRLREAGSNAAKALRLIAGMDLMSASAVAFNAARELEAALKGESHE